MTRRRGSAPRSARALTGALAVLLAGLALAGCVPASPDADTYDDKVLLTVESAISETRTVGMLVRTLADGEMPRPVVVAQLRLSEDGLDTATGALTELNPPPRRDRLADEVDTLLQNAGDLLVQARVAVEREDAASYPRLVRDLEALARRLERVEARLS